MHSDAVSNLAGSHIYSVIGLVLFLAAFAVIIAWTVRMDRSEIDKVSRLPLDSGTAPTPDGDKNHE